MKRQIWLAGALGVLLWATPAKANNRVIVRSTLGLQGLQQLCLVQNCTVVSPPLDGTIGQVFLLTTPLDPTVFVTTLSALPGIVDAEVDQLIHLDPAGSLNVVPTPLPAGLMSDRSSVAYPASSTTMVWNSYASQPAAGIVNVQNAQSQFQVTGTGIVADIDTGVDPNHPALQGVLLQGYDFTRNQPGGSEMTDLTATDFPTYPPPQCTSSTCPSAVIVNQSTAAVLDQSTAAVLDTNVKYAAFGHGTMVMGVIHLVAPTAQLLPLKAFSSDGTGNLSDILRAIYYGAQNNANVINMSFDTTAPSTELKNALDYASQLGLISAASAGNEGQAAPPNLVYPAVLQSDVMGVASVGSTSATDGTRSSFSNYGTPIVWVAAPGEEIVTTYPFSTYSAGWGTSFSAPFVSGGAALLRSLNTTIGESQAAAAVAHAVPLTDPGMDNGRLDLLQALGALPAGSGSPDYTVSAAPASQSITAGEPSSYTVTAAPAHGFAQTVTWKCTGAPVGATCTVSPSSVTLDGTHSAAAAVTLTTMARGFVPPLLVLPPTASPVRLWVMWTACFAWLAMLLLLCKLGRASGLQRGIAAAVGILAVSLCVYACGGGYSNGGGPGSRSPTLTSVVLNPPSVNGGSSSTGTVTLSGAAPTYGALVSLSSNMSAATVPASVTIPAGATSATFTVNTSAVTSSTSVTVSASYGGATKTAMLTVTPTTGTPAGTYTLTVTGTSGTLSHSTTVQVTVN
jgi:hypothetical protein